MSCCRRSRMVSQLIAELPSSLFSTPGRAITPHLIRSPAAARAVGARTVLEGVIHRRAIQRGTAHNKMPTLEPEPVAQMVEESRAPVVVRARVGASAYTSLEMAKHAKLKEHGLMPIGMCNTMKKVQPSLRIAWGAQLAVYAGPPDRASSKRQTSCIHTCWVLRFSTSSQGKIMTRTKF